MNERTKYVLTGIGEALLIVALAAEMVIVYAAFL